MVGSLERWLLCTVLVSIYYCCLCYFFWFIPAWAHLHALPLPANRPPLYMRLPPTLCVCCSAGAAAGLLMRMYGSRCRLPAGSPALEMHRIYSQLSLSLWLSLPLSATPSSLFSFGLFLSIPLFFWGVIFVSSTPAWHRHTEELQPPVVNMFLGSLYMWDGKVSVLVKGKACVACQRAGCCMSTKNKLNSFSLSFFSSLFFTSFPLVN